MSKSIRRFLLGNLWDFGKNESWFSDMALKGMHLQSIGSWFVVFEKGEPKKTRYRIEILEEGPSHEQVELYKEYGWDLVADKQIFCVFSSPEELNAPELQTDPMELGFTFRMIDKQLKKNMILISILFITFLFSQLQLFFHDEPYLFFIKQRAFTIIMIILPYMYVFIESIRGYITVKKTRNSLLMGIPINHKRNWKLSYLFSAIIHVYLTALIGGVLITPFYTAIRREAYTYKPVEDTPVVSIYDIETDPVYAYSHFIDYDWSIICPVQYSIYEDAYMDGEMEDDLSGAYFQTSIHTRYYELAFKGLSDGLINDLINRHYREYHYEEKLTEIINKSFDRLYAASGEGKNIIFASFDNKVIYIKYSGKAELNYLISLIEKKHNLQLQL